MNEKDKGVITDSNGYSFSIKYVHLHEKKTHLNIIYFFIRSQSSQEQWTKALKYMLTNLKWGKKAFRIVN